MSELPEKIPLIILDSSESPSLFVIHHTKYMVELPSFPSFEWDILVIDTPKGEDLILGFDFLNHFNPSIDWRQGLITFNSAYKDYYDPSKSFSNDFYSAKSCADLYLDVFSKVKVDKLPPHHTCDHHIELEGSVPPAGVIYSLSNQESDTLRANISENLEKGFIRPSSSSTGAPVLSVKKNAGGLSLCVDSRKLNAVTRKNKYPVPPMNKLLTVSNGSFILSKIDLRGAYKLLRIKEGDEHLASFGTRYGSYEDLSLSPTQRGFHHHFNPSLPTIVETNASNYALGAVLIQVSDSGKYPIALNSSNPIPEELNYEIHDKELLGIVWALKRWRIFLPSLALSFEVLTYHSSLQYFMFSKVLTHLQARWDEFLSKFHFSITYHPGHLVTLLDALPFWDNVYLERGEDFISKNRMNFQQLIKQDEVQPSRYFAFKVKSFSNLIDSIQKALWRDSQYRSILQELGKGKSVQYYSLIQILGGGPK
ncbi:hypothetical protein O181_027450 [Austropuccinia psidii MF-1]|uniref:RNA-directed DNA polymerase n=1 Tax=Austropuccinia psidii MF-1 TaxID=1389203 RepID=A0A9Q3H383_9BASI|nr:hypothetical protein [Austropuccinia psidii MF-1]